MDRQKLMSQLAIDEGRRPLIYLDSVGKWTGGVGRNLVDRPFSDDEIDLMLRNDVAIVEKELDRRLPWWREMAPARQNALANMCFNLGINRLLGFVQALTHMRAGQYDAAAREMRFEMGQAGRRPRRPSSCPHAHRRIPMKARFFILVLATALAGCSNLALQCSGTYTGNEVRNGAAGK